MECEFCKKNFKTKSVLITHQKTAKFCLKLQGKESDIEYKCVCDKVFNRKSHLNNHQKICSVKNYVIKIEEKENLLNSKVSIIDEKDKIIIEKENIIQEKDYIIENKEKILKDFEKKLRVKEKQIYEKEKLILEKDRIINEQYKIIERKEKEINILTGEINIYKQDHKVFVDIAKQPKTTNNNKVLNISTPLDFNDVNKVKNALENYNINYFLEGQKGMAKFAAENILKDPSGEYIYVCTDPSRAIFKYKDETGDIQKDIEAKKLTNYLIQGGIKNVATELSKNFIEKNTEIINTDVILEKNIEVIDLESNNNTFKKELASITTV